MKHETGFNNDKTRKALQHHANTALKALIFVGRIAERTASCFTCYYFWESILFGSELLSIRFFTLLDALLFTVYTR